MAHGRGSCEGGEEHGASAHHQHGRENQGVGGNEGEGGFPNPGLTCPHVVLPGAWDDPLPWG